MKLSLVIVFFFGLAVGTSRAQAPFFQDKTIAVVLGGPPAGSADMRTRAVTNILRKHIPGNPTIVVQYMAAAAAGRRRIMFTKWPSRTA